MEKRAKKIEREYVEKFETKNRALDNKREERSETQLKFDNKHKEGKTRVAR